MKLNFRQNYYKYSSGIKQLGCLSLLFDAIYDKGIVRIVLYAYICGIYASNQKSTQSYHTNMKITQQKEKHTKMII